MDKEILKELRMILKEELEPIKIQLTENTQILKALEHSSQVNKAEHDKMANDIAKIQGDVTGIKNDLAFVEEATAKNWKDIASLKVVR